MSPLRPHYRRNLPHYQPEPSRRYFLTVRLAGTLPANWRQKGDKLTPGQSFAQLDYHLDRVAKLVIQTLHYLQDPLNLYHLHAWVIMSNHLHILFTAQDETPLARITAALKNHTARQANGLLDRTGHPFSQHESYDRVVRNEAEFGRIWRYIERNPVAAHLVEQPEHYPWSSAHL